VHPFTGSAERRAIVNALRYGVPLSGTGAEAFMRKALILGIAAALAGSLAFADLALADGQKRKGMKRKPAVAEYNRRANVGGYSYDYSDAIIDYRDETILEAPNIYESTGPLDNDMFFDTNVTPFGSDAPYMN
jgi:hypothetical protein